RLSTLFPYTTLFRSQHHAGLIAYGPLAEGLLTDRYLDGFPADMPLHRTNAFIKDDPKGTVSKLNALNKVAADRGQTLAQLAMARSEEHTSELQSRFD